LQVFFAGPKCNRLDLNHVMLLHLNSEATQLEHRRSKESTEKEEEEEGAGEGAGEGEKDLFMLAAF
jgi:hypothetical protein